MEFIKKHSDKILITAGAAALLFGGYYMLTHSKQQQKTVVEVQTKVSATAESLANVSVIFVKDDKYHTFIEKLKPIVRSELTVGDLSKNTIITINQTVIHLFKNDYVRLLLDGRRIRRKFLDNADLYAREFTKNTVEAEKLMENASLEVLKDLNIDLQAYERSSERIMASDPNFAMFNLYMFESVKMQVPSQRTRVLTKADLIKILNFQREQYANADFGSLNLAPEQNVMLKQTYASDRASIAFDYEEEDIMKNPALLQDPEVMDAQRQLQNTMLSEQANMNYFG